MRRDRCACKVWNGCTLPSFFFHEGSAPSCMRGVRDDCLVFFTIVWCQSLLACWLDWACGVMYSNVWYLGVYCVQHPSLCSAGLLYANCYVVHLILYLQGGGWHVGCMQLLGSVAVIGGIHCGSMHAEGMHASSWSAVNRFHCMPDPW